MIIAVIMIVMIVITRLGVDRVKPWNSVKITLGLCLRGPDITRS